MPNSFCYEMLEVVSKKSIENVYRPAHEISASSNKGLDNSECMLNYQSLCALAFTKYECV